MNTGIRTIIDVLLLQLGTPDAPTTAGLRPYLRQFLSDPRIIEGSAFFRWLLVNLIIVPFRSPKSAAKYQKIWDAKTGSPLLSISRSQQKALQAKLGDQFRVHLGMRYGNPSIESVVKHLTELRASDVIVVPMYPQYSATTTASSFDALFDAFKKERVIPSVKIIQNYYDEPSYLDAVETRVRETLESVKGTEHEPKRFLISFHGIPWKYIERGDPYYCESYATGIALAERMGWTKENCQIVFQSRLGRQKWIEPYTDQTLKALGREGVKCVLVTQPGFTADCLETIDEIGREGVEEFESTGGKHLVRVPCLNDHPKFIECLAQLVKREAANCRPPRPPANCI